MAHVHEEMLRQREDRRLLTTQGDAVRQPLTHDARHLVVGGLAVDETLVPGNAGVESERGAEEVSDHFFVS